MVEAAPDFGPVPAGATAVLVLADASVIWGVGAGAPVQRVGEVCFNTSMTGYQEILTDPSYAGQLITFTFPHIGNVGVNGADTENTVPHARGCILRADITEPSNFRATGGLDAWLVAQDLPAITGIDTRALTRRIRDAGAPNGVLAHCPDGRFDLPALWRQARDWPGLENMDLAGQVSCRKSHEWDGDDRNENDWEANNRKANNRDGQGDPPPSRRVVVIDYGTKHHILRCLAARGCRVTVVPADCPANTILALRPDGVVLSNGPGDPVATGAYAIPVIRDLIAADMPIFGICLGHQLLALALGARTRKMHLGHRGANHPIKDLSTGQVAITSQNHGFVVDGDSLPDGVSATHLSLFDGSLAGLRMGDRPVFSVQYHPEASPGPQDSRSLFDRFLALLATVPPPASAPSVPSTPSQPPPHQTNLSSA